jgi:hypothetical protein
MQLRSFAGVAALSVSLLAGSGGKSQADFSLSINVGNTGSSGIGSLTGPYASVTFMETGASTLHVVIQALNNGGNFYLFRTVGLNLATGVSFVPLSLTSTAGLGSISPSFGGPDMFDGFGTTNHSVQAGNGGDAGLTSMSFDLTGIAVVGDGSNFLTPNSDGTLVAMHINAYANSDYSGGAIKTGFGAQTGAQPQPVPAPTALVMIASGGIFSGAGLALRRRMRRNPNAASGA